MRQNSAVLWIVVLFANFINVRLFGQGVTQDSARFDYKKIYSYCLDGDIPPALSLVDSAPDRGISNKDLQFKKELESRFKFEQDSSNYLLSKRSALDPLLLIYHDYWRTGLLNPQEHHDSDLVETVAKFLRNGFTPANDLSVNHDSIDKYEQLYIEHLGFHTAGFSKTGKFFDLLVWKTQKDTIYSFVQGDEQTSVHVVFMDDFITLGWEEFATLGRYYPGGWTTPKELYCVKSAYDLKSEKFLVSYLAHESRHFADYKLFPKLKSADLEYRAKLTELSLAKSSLYQLLDFFIGNANPRSENGHSVADYCVIRDMSKSLFNTEFEKDISKWKQLSPAVINKGAAEILQANTKTLQSMGPSVEHYITP
jgi:hypothetical protein